MTMAQDIPYLLRGITQLTTDSSTLISSSKYLNNPALREWLSQELLRRNGKDLPVPSGAFRLSQIIKDMQDFDMINDMFEQERKRLPELDRFLSEGFVSSYTRDDLKQYPPESVAGLFYTIMTEGDYQVDIVPPWEPKTHYELYLLRSGQVHDMEHIITGGPFDSPGEVVTAFARLENVHKYFSPELASELTVMGFFGAFRFLTRTVMHYPQVWHDMFGAMERGRRVGKASDLFVLSRYEDVFHLTPAEARKVLGVREVDDTVDTTRAHRIWNELPVDDEVRAEAAE